MPEFLVVGNDRSVNILRFQELGKTVIFWGVQKYDLDFRCSGRYDDSFHKFTTVAKKMSIPSNLYASVSYSY